MRVSSTIFGGLAAVATTVNGALLRVNDFGSNPTNLQMNIYVPAKVAPKPAIILAVSTIFQRIGY
jgi:acetylxylan esterase